MSSFSESGSADQLAISVSVRLHPSHSWVFVFILHRDMQGDGAKLGVSDMNGAHKWTPVNGAAFF
jgi:hypothetical protein